MATHMGISPIPVRLDKMEPVLTQVVDFVTSKSHLDCDTSFMLDVHKTMTINTLIIIETNEATNRLFTYGEFEMLGIKIRYTSRLFEVSFDDNRYDMINANEIKIVLRFLHAFHRVSERYSMVKL